MKEVIFILTVLSQSNYLIGQYFAPNDLIVNATELRFREEPNQNGQVIDILDNGEILEFLEFVPHSEPSFQLYEKLSFTWLKTKRKLDGRTGFVFGQYIQPAKLALRYGQDYNKLPNLNWYGITLNNEKTKIETTFPEIVGSEHNKRIIDSLQSYVIIGSKDKYQVGQIDGTVFHNENLLILKENEHRVIEFKNEYKLKIEVCHDIELIADQENESIIERLFITVIDTTEKEIVHQELTNQFNHKENKGFWIHFIGDLNNDFIPEILLSPLSEKGGRNLWFESQSQEIKLQSITEYGTGC